MVFLQHNGMLSTAGWSVVPFCMQHERNNPSAWSHDFVEEIEFDGAHDGGVAKVRKGLKAVYLFEARRKVRSLLDGSSPTCATLTISTTTCRRPSWPRFRARRAARHDAARPKLACPAYKMLAPDGVCERCRGGRLAHVLEQRCMKGSRLLSLLVMLESYLHRYLRSYLDNVDRFIVPSRFYIDKFVDWGFERSRFWYVPKISSTQRTTPATLPGAAVRLRRPTVSGERRPHFARGCRHAPASASTSSAPGQPRPISKPWRLGTRL